MKYESGDVQQIPVRAVVAVVVVAVIAIAAYSSFFVVPPGHRGVKVTLGKVSKDFYPEGFGIKYPFISDIRNVSIRKDTAELASECYSSDLQQVNVRMKVQYSIPETAVVSMFQQYAGDPFQSLFAPRVQEALKEKTALQSAEQIVKSRESIKAQTLASAREKVGDVVLVHDLVIENIALSKQLEEAIEQKMVQEQEASKAKFTQDKSKIESETKAMQAEIDARATVTRAKAEAESIRIRGGALRENPDLIALQIVEKWDGRSPQVIAGAGGSGNGAAGAANIILPINTPALQQNRP